MEPLFSPSDLICSYSRAQAIEDGVLVDLTEGFPELARQIYRYPVACTSEVWEILDEAAKDGNSGNDFKGLVWDLLWMSVHGKVRQIDPTQHLFRVAVRRGRRVYNHTFKIVCGPGDDAAPVLTIMLPDQD